MHNLRWLSLPALALLAGTTAAQTVRSNPQSKLTIDQLIQIKHPSGHQWTPDGSHAWFTYDSGGVNNVWTVAADGRTPPMALTSYPAGQTGDGGFWSKDGQVFFFQRNGGLLAVPVNGGTPHAAWPSSTHARGFMLSPDGTRISFLVGQRRGGANSAGVEIGVRATRQPNQSRRMVSICSFIQSRPGPMRKSRTPTAVSTALAGRPTARSSHLRRRQRMVRLI